MKARIYLLVNDAEITKSAAMGITIDPQEELFDFDFSMKYVTAMWRHSQKRMVVYILGDPFVLEYNKELYNTIKEFLNHDIPTQKKEAQG